MMNDNGRGVPKDDAEVVRRCRLAAEQGNAAAQTLLGAMYANGEGVPEDAAEAVRWFRLAADQGDVRAQNDLTQRDWPRPAQEPILDEAGMARCAAVQQFAHGLPHLSQ